MIDVSFEGNIEATIRHKAENWAFDMMTFIILSCTILQPTNISLFQRTWKTLFANVNGKWLVCDRAYVVRFTANIQKIVDRKDDEHAKETKRSEKKMHGCGNCIKMICIVLWPYCILSNNIFPAVAHFLHGKSGVWYAPLIHCNRMHQQQRPKKNL